MSIRTTLRKVSITLLIVMIAVWAEAGVALVQGDQVMQCSMTMHQMQAMGEKSCCSMGETPAAMSAERPPCCSISNQPERPLGFEVSSKQVKGQLLKPATLPATVFFAPPAQDSRTWRTADAPRFVKPVLDLKTDLRI
jgi:hypothetical protein